MANKKLYGGSGLFNDRPRNPASSKSGEATVGITGQYQGQPSLGDLFGAQVLAPLPSITQDSTAAHNSAIAFPWQPSESVKPKETGSIAGLFAGTSPFEIGPSFKKASESPSPQGARGESSKGRPGNDDDMKFLSDMLEKKFGYEKRGASIRQGMSNAAQGNTQLHSISNALMGLG